MINRTIYMIRNVIINVGVFYMYFVVRMRCDVSWSLERLLQLVFIANSIVSQGFQKISLSGGLCNGRTVQPSPLDSSLTHSPVTCH